MKVVHTNQDETGSLPASELEKRYPPSEMSLTCSNFTKGNQLVDFERWEIMGTAYPTYGLALSALVR